MGEGLTITSVSLDCSNGDRFCHELTPKVSSNDSLILLVIRFDSFGQ